MVKATAMTAGQTRRDAERRSPGDCTAFPKVVAKLLASARYCVTGWVFAANALCCGAGSGAGVAAEASAVVVEVVADVATVGGVSAGASLI
jgi:hypothetical protein